MALLFFLLIFVKIILITSGHPHERRRNDEPICSKFDYEEKLLEKIIRMESKMEKIIEEVKYKENEVLTIATDVSQRVGNMENSAIQFQLDDNRTIIGLSDNFKEETAKLEALAGIHSFNSLSFN
jgi:hypothetical protein